MSNDEQHDDQAPAPPREKKHWEMKPHEKLEWMRREREKHRFVRQEKVVEVDPEVEQAIAEGRCVTGPYDPYR